MSLRASTSSSTIATSFSTLVLALLACLTTSSQAFFVTPSSFSATARVPRQQYQRPRLRLSMTTAVCFDFDGTLGDTESPAMEVAFWEVAAYLPSLPVDDPAALQSFKQEFIENNAGRAFEFMVEDINKEREGKGLSTVEEAWSVLPSDPKILSLVDAARAKFQLKPLTDVLAAQSFPSIFTMQKEETNMALAVATKACDGVLDVCNLLTKEGTPFCIATTSPKPRVPISVKAASLEPFFPPEKIHSGESDFDPPRFKPAPDVYLKAAAAEKCDPEDCIAVEDSGSGVGSAANARMGLIIGYVGASHIPAGKKESHAKMLMAGEKSEDGRGALLVVEEFRNVAVLVNAFKAARAKGDGKGGKPGAFAFGEDVIQGLKGRVWLPEGKVLVNN